MATVTLGNIKFNWKGAWNSATAYVVDDVVSLSGSSYVCIQAGTNQNPSTATAYWEQMSSAGTDGTDLTTTLTTQGDIVYRDASGLARLGAGTSGQFLKTQGTGANPTWDNLASNVDIVSYTTLDSTGVNTITTTTDWATNNYWKMEMFTQYGVTSSQGAKLRLRNASGDISSDTYQYLGMHNYDQTNNSNNTFASHRDLDGNRTETEINGWGYNASNKNPFWLLTVFKPDANNRQSYYYDYYNNDTTSPNYHAWYRWHVWNNDTNAKKGWSIYANNNANFINGFYVILGYKYQ